MGVGVKRFVSHLDQGSGLDGGFAAYVVAGGSAALGIASLLWALRVTDGARGGVERSKERNLELENKLALSDAIFGAHPGRGDRARLQSR